MGQTNIAKDSLTEIKALTRLIRYWKSDLASHLISDKKTKNRSDAICNNAHEAKSLRLSLIEDDLIIIKEQLEEGISMTPLKQRHMDNLASTIRNIIH